MRGFIGVITALTTLGVLPAAAAPCAISHFNFVFGSDTDSTMTTRAGARCVGHINGRSALAEGSVSQPPQHGTAFVDEHRFGYQPQPGYVGPDTFSIALTGTSYRKGRSSTYAIDGTTHVNFAVQVVR